MREKQWAGSAERHQGRLARIDALLDGDLADGACHVRRGDLHDAARHLVRVEAELASDRLERGQRRRAVRFRSPAKRPAPIIPSCTAASVTVGSVPPRP